MTPGTTIVGSESFYLEYEDKTTRPRTLKPMSRYIEEIEDRQHIGAIGIAREWILPR